MDFKYVLYSVDVRDPDAPVEQTVRDLTAGSGLAFEDLGERDWRTVGGPDALGTRRRAGRER